MKTKRKTTFEKRNVVLLWYKRKKELKGVNYNCVYFDVIDTIVAWIQDRFNQAGFRICQNIDQFLLNAVNNKNYEEQPKKVLAGYGRNLDIIILTAQLESLKVNFPSKSHNKDSVKDTIEKPKRFSVNSRKMFSQVIIFLKILLAKPATNAVSEIYAELKISVTWKRLNHCMILSVHKERTDNPDVVVAANDMCREKKEALEYFW